MEQTSLFAPKKEGVERGDFEILDLTGRQKFIEWTKPLRNFSRRVADRPEYENIDANYLMLSAMAFIVGESGIDWDGPARRDILSYLARVAGKMDPGLAPDETEKIAAETLRALDNRSADLDCNGPAFEMRWYEASAEKMEKRPFRLTECFKDIEGEIRYRPTSETFALLSRLPDLKSEDRASLQATLLSNILKNDKKRARAENTAAGLVDALIEERSKIRGLLEELCRGINAKRWEKEMNPILADARELLDESHTNISNITNYLLNSPHVDNAALIDLANRINTLWAALGNDVAEAPAKYREASQRRLRIRGARSFHASETLDAMLHSQKGALEKAIEDIFPAILPPVFPVLPDLPSIIRLLREKEKKETPAPAEYVSERKFQPFAPTWQASQMKQMAQIVEQEIMAGAKNLTELLQTRSEQGASAEELRLLVYTVFGFYMSRALKPKARLRVEGHFILPDMAGSGFTFDLEENDA